MWVDLRLGKKKRKCLEEEAMTSATWADLKEPRPSDIVVVCPALPLGEWQLGIAGSCSLGPWPQSSTFISSLLPSPFSSPRVFCTGQQVPLGPGEQHIGLQVCSTQCKECTLQKQRDVIDFTPLLSYISLIAEAIHIRGEIQPYKSILLSLILVPKANN